MKASSACLKSFSLSAATSPSRLRGIIFSMEEPSDFEKEKIERLRRAMYSRSLEGKLGERPRRQLHDIRPVVGEDWVQHEEGLDQAVVAPRSLGIIRSALWWALLASVVFFIGAVLFFMYYFVLGPGSTAASPSNVDIAVSGPPEVQGGEQTKLQVVITNRNKVPLELADLVVTYPQGTRSATDYTTDWPSDRITLGTIEPGGSRQGSLAAVFTGPAGSHETVKLELEYHLSGSNSIFVADSTYDITLGSSPVSLSVGGNSETISGQPVQFAVTAGSNTNAPVKDVLVHVAFPFGFKYASSDLADPSGGSAKASPIIDQDGSGALWPIGDLSPGQKKTITISGALTGQSGDQRVFHVEAGTRADPQASSIDTPIADAEYSLAISQPFLGLTLAVNQKSGADAIAGPGDNVTVTVGYQNNLPTNITDAIVVARLSGVQIDGTTVHSTDGFYRSTDSTMLWDKTTTNGALGTLAPGAKGTLSFTFQMPASDALKGILNPHLTIAVNAAGKRLAESGVPQNLQSAVQQNVKLATDLQMNAQALYYASPFGSSGPMPPQAGKETDYALVFTITNTTNKLTNVQVKASLPSYVRYLGLCAPKVDCDQAANKLVFNPSDGTFTWNIGDLDPGVGVGSTTPKQLAIALGFTPSTSQIGEQPALIQNIMLTGIDAATGATVTRTTKPDVTTNLAIISESSGTAIVGTDPGFSPANATVVK